MARLAPYAFVQELDNDGKPLVGGKIYTYDAGTSTPKATYTDSSEATQNANPIILDANGRAEIWLGTGNYKFILRDANDVLIKEVDDIVGQATGGIVSYDLSTNTSITSLYDRANIYVSGTTTLSLLSAADAEDGFEFWVYNGGSGVVTLDPDASELIDGGASLDLQSGQNVRVMCDGNAWFTFASFAASSVGDMFTGNTETNITATYQSADGTIDLEVPDASTTVKGVVELATAGEVTDGTAGKVVDAAQLKSKASNVRTLGRSYTSISTRDTTTTAIPADNTKPTSSEGKEFLSTTYTRISATSTLIVRFGGSISSSVGALCCVALFNGGSEAVSTLPSNAAASGSQEYVSGVYEQASGAVGDITFSLRFGANAGTAHLNGNSAIAGDLYGATNNSFLEIIEVE